MTKKDYELIAGVIKEAGEDGALCMDDASDRVRLAMMFANKLIGTNPLFDTDRFMAAATLTGDIEEYDANPSNW